MLGPPPGTRVFLACGVTDMRKGFDGLAARVRTALAQDPYGGAPFCFRGRRGGLLEILVRDGQGLVLVAKGLERGKFVWPQAASGVVSLTPAMLSMLSEGIDRRMPAWTARPATAVQRRAAPDRNCLGGHAAWNRAVHTAAPFGTPDAETAALRALLTERDAALAERDARPLNAPLEIGKLKVRLAALRRDRYGKPSERLTAGIGQLEMLVGGLGEDQAERGAAAAEEARRTGGKPDKPRRPALRKPLPARLPRETVAHEPVLACRCGCADPARLTRLGEDVTEALEKAPARLKVVRHVRPRCACRACGAVLQAPAPDLPIERGRPGPGLPAHVLVSKCLDGLPLCRLSGILGREGVEIERRTLAGWVGHGAWWLTPVAEAIGAYATGQGVVWTDDTPIRVLAPGHGKTRQARFWVYAFDPGPRGGTGPPAALHRHSPDRKGERPRGHLAGFGGWLHADAYAGHDALTASEGGKPPRVAHVACWAHARRRLFEVFEATKSPIAEEGPRRIQELYAIEAAINGRPAEQRRSEREARSKPLLDALHGWMEAQRRRLPGKSALGKALRYALGRWDALTRHVEDGRLSIDNNLAGRQLRGVAVTRKNFLFLGSDTGGRRAAAIYTVAETAKLNGLDPEAYIAAILDRLARGHPASRIDELLPWNFEKHRQAA